MGSEALGVLLTLGSCLGAALGYVLQKRAHVRREGLAPSDRGPLWRNVGWATGLVFMVASAGLAVAAAPMLDTSKSATLGTATIVFSSLLAWLLLGEELAVLDVGAITLAVLGTVIAMASAEPSVTYSFAQTTDLLKDGLVVAFCVIAFPLAAIAAFLVERAAATPREGWRPWQCSLMQIAPPLLGGFCNNQVLYSSKVLTSVIFAKDWAALREVSYWVYAAGAGFAVAGQVRWLNTGLKFFEVRAGGG